MEKGGLFSLGLGLFCGYTEAQKRKEVCCVCRYEMEWSIETPFHVMYPLKRKTGGEIDVTFTSFIVMHDENDRFNFHTSDGTCYFIVVSRTQKQEFSS